MFSWLHPSLTMTRIIAITIIVIIIKNILITWLHLSSTLAKTSGLGSLSSSMYETPTLIWSQGYGTNICGYLKLWICLPQYCVCVYFCYMQAACLECLPLPHLWTSNLAGVVLSHPPGEGVDILLLFQNRRHKVLSAVLLHVIMPEPFDVFNMMSHLMLSFDCLPPCKELIIIIIILIIIINRQNMILLHLGWSSLQPW